MANNKDAERKPGHWLVGRVQNKSHGGSGGSGPDGVMVLT
jgi:hypothetical protein